MAVHKTNSNKDIKNDNSIILGAQSNNLNTGLDIRTILDIDAPDITLPGTTDLKNQYGLDKLVSGGVFAYDNPQYIGYFITDKLAGLPNGILKVPSTKTNPKLEYARGTTQRKMISINYLTHKITYHSDAGNINKFWSPQTNNVIDQEELPTFYVPGSFVYLNGNPTPIMKNYEKKNLA